MPGGYISGEAAGDQSGGHLALSADGLTLAVGAKFNDAVGNPNAGHVRVFRYDGTNWNQLGNDLDGPEAGDLSGIQVALSADGTIVAAGATLAGTVTQWVGTPTDYGGGNVRVHKWDGAVWNEIGQEGDINGAEAYDAVGQAMSMSADGLTIATTAPYKGLIFVYDYDAGQNRWGVRGGGTAASIVATSFRSVSNYPHSQSGGLQGYTVELSGDGMTVITGNRDTLQEVRVLRWTGTLWDVVGANICDHHSGLTWHQNPHLTYDFNRDAEGACRSGYHTNVALSFDGNTIAIGKKYSDDNAVDAGHVLIFTYDALTHTSGYKKALTFLARRCTPRQVISI